MNIISALESLLYVKGDEGLTINEIKQVFELSEEELLRSIEELQKEYEDPCRGIYLEKYGNIYKLVTKKECAIYCERLVETEVNNNLSQSALEVLALIAYNGPITRIMIDEIRGVGSAHIIRRLLLKNLIKEAGKEDTPGRPNLYTVTDHFFDYFGIKGIEELPKINFESEDDSEEKDLFSSRYKEI